MELVLQDGMLSVDKRDNPTEVYVRDNNENYAKYSKNHVELKYGSIIASFDIPELDLDFHLNENVSAVNLIKKFMEILAIKIALDLDWFKEMKQNANA